MNRQDAIDRMKVDNDLRMPTAEEVSDKIMNDIKTEHDPFSWKSFTPAYQAELIAQLIADIASFKANTDLTRLQNRSEQLSIIEYNLKMFLMNAAEREGYLK